MSSTCGMSKYWEGDSLVAGKPGLNIGISEEQGATRSAYALTFETRWHHYGSQAALFFYFNIQVQTF